jgi:AcrR family transcriptional regulator
MTIAADTVGKSGGLRERHRQRTLAQLEEVALRLFEERGYDAVTIDDITAAADVSRRTFFRYFPGKEDLLFADQRQRAEALRRALAARPNSEPPMTALRQALMSLATEYEVDREQLLRRKKIMAATPSLQARSLAHQRWGEQFVTDLMAEWLGVDPARDLRPAIVAATTLAAMRVAFNTWLAGGGKGDLHALVSDALDLLDGGLQEGVTRPVKPTSRRRTTPSAAAERAAKSRRPRPR